MPWGFSSSPIGGGGLRTLISGSCLQGIILIVIGIVALFITVLYFKDKDSASYRLSIVIGTLVGIVSMVVSITLTPCVEGSTLFIALVGSFALAMRLPRNVNFPVILALLVSVVAYILLDDIRWLDPNGWLRIIISLLLGAVVYVMLHFLRAVASVLLNVLNHWPVFAALAVVCIIEGVCVLFGCNSIIKCAALFLS